jgi:AraC-like DNA-binding protein
MAMTLATFATHALSASEQFDAWSRWHASVFEAASPQPTVNGFPARMTAWMLGGFGVSRVSTPPIRITRTKALIRRNPVDHWCISLGKRGATGFAIAGKTMAAPARVPFVFSLGEEVSGDWAHGRIHLYLARDNFEAIAPLLDAARGTVLDTPEGHLLADYLLLLERNVPHLPVTDGPKLARAIQAMMAACLAPSAELAAQAERHISLTLMERVRQAVSRNLRSPSLGPDKLCREAATSRSQLYRLLEGEGGVAHYIKRRRLSESFSLLGDASNDLPISKVADMLCFADGSSFSRAFRREFGMSPSDVRTRAHVGLPSLPRPTESRESSARGFGEYLRSL